jgi:beta-glucosidase
MLQTTDKNLQDSAARVAKMTLKEKVGLMTGRGLTKLMLPIHFVFFKHYNRAPYPNNPVPRLGVPSIKFCDGPRGVVSQHSTCFPVAMARGATFDVDLERRVGDVIGKEVIAAGGNYFAGVCINLLRHPAWGRAQEVYGEDPHLLGRMGVAVIEGVQALGVMACVKHFAMNSMENARFKVDVQCSERTLHEVYLPHFKMCIDAGAASVMSAYNKVQGEYCGQNKKLLRDILKGEWGFNGFVISDFIWGVHDTVASAENGLDIEMPWPKYFGNKLVKAIKAGKLDVKHVDEAARRITATTLRFAETLSRHPFDPGIVACEEHRQLALLVAEKSMTLLKNENTTLPLDRAVIKRLAVLGKLARQKNIGDNGSSKVKPPYVVTPLQGLETLLGDDVAVDYCDDDDAATVSKACAAADAVVIVVGNRYSDEGEYLTNSAVSLGGDRDQLGLRPQDIALIEAAAGANQRCIVVLIGGSAITVSEWQGKVASILYAYYPGMEGGTAIANTLFGLAVPGGKLPFSIPTDATHLPFFDKNAKAIEYGYYHGYTLLEKDNRTPAYAFGFGLSYSQFELSDAHFSTSDKAFIAEVFVTNVGQRAADEVVQLYIGCSQSSVDRPGKILRAFERISVAAGQSVRVRLTAGLDSMRYFDESIAGWRFEALAYELYIGTSSRDQDLIAGQVDLSGAAQH